MGRAGAGSFKNDHVNPKSNKAPWIYRMCHKLHNSSIKYISTYIVAASACAYGGHKLSDYLIQTAVEQDINYAQAQNDKYGYVTLDVANKNLATGNVTLAGELKRVSLEEAKQEILSASENDHITPYVLPGLLGLMGGVMVMGGVLNLAEAGSSARNKWINKHQPRYGTGHS